MLEHCRFFRSKYLLLNIALFLQTRGFSGKLWSPTHVLATQIGNSLEISCVLVSFLLGFGFKAFVVCGWVDAITSKMDRSQELCKLLEEREVNTNYINEVFSIDMRWKCKCNVFLKYLKCST